jgi:hypothetical protein
MQTLSNKPTHTPIVNTASKDLLARILATENISVQHDAKAHTASFNTKSRVLILPAWTGMTNEVYDMLVGHEVGHALFTPHTDADDKVRGPWCGAAEEIAGTAGASVAQVYMNIVEDARIERLMKEKFPGMRRDFFKAYEQFTANDLFGVKGRDLNNLPLIDRINLHYKMGTCMDTGIQFSPIEQSFISRIDKCRTFDDVKDIVRDIWDYESNRKEDGKDEDKNTQSSGSGSASGDATDSAGEGSPMDGDSTDAQDKSDSGSGSGSDKTDEQSDDGASAASGKSNDKDGDKESAANGKKQQDQQQTPPHGASIGAGASKMQHKTLPPSATTQQRLDDAVKNMADKSGTHYDYYTLPRCDTSKVIISHNEISNIISEFYNKGDDSLKRSHNDLMTAARKDYAKFVSDSTPVINIMCKQFDLRKAADAAKRTSVARTGVLDTVRMVNYKITEDIFRRNAVVRDGKNHGLVMFIDWSGSMAPTLLDTVKQLMQIALFCRRCNIPFEVYAFSSALLHKDIKGASIYDTDTTGKVWKSTNKDKDAKFHYFSLLNLISSKMRPNQFKSAMENLFALAMAQTGFPYAMPAELGLGSTPLDESIVAAMEIVPQFREDNRLQIVHSVFLTDGETSGSFAYAGNHYNRKFVTDPVTRKTYEVLNTSTSTLLRMFRDRTGCNAIGFFLYDRKNLSFLTHYFSEYAINNKTRRMEAVHNNKTKENMNKQMESWKDNGFAIANTSASGYTEQYIIRASTKIEDTDAMNDLGADASMTRIKNAFVSNASKRMKSRVMLNRFIDLISK